MKTKKFLMAGVCAIGFLVSAFAEVGTTTWFAEDSVTVEAASKGDGTTPYGTWSNLQDQVTVADGKVSFDTEDETAIAYGPKVALPTDRASVTLTNVTFNAARKTLPEIPETVQAGVALTTNAEGVCVFAVVNDGAWTVTAKTANPDAEYTVRCDFVCIDFKGLLCFGGKQESTRNPESGTYVCLCNVLVVCDFCGFKNYLNSLEA